MTVTRVKFWALGSKVSRMATIRDPEYACRHDLSRSYPLLMQLPVPKKWDWSRAMQAIPNIAIGTIIILSVTFLIGC